MVSDKTIDSVSDKTTELRLNFAVVVLVQWLSRV